MGAYCCRQHKQVRPAPNPLQFPFWLQNKQGLWLHTQAWEVENPTCIVFICHGYGEHSGRYEHLALFLNQKNISVYSMDHQGFGHSEGDSGFVQQFDDYVEDYLSFMNKRLTEGAFRVSGQRLDQLPRFLLGHSLGGLIAVNVAQKAPGLRGVILSGPALEADPTAATPTMVFLAKLMSRVAPHIYFEAAKPEHVSNDLTVVERCRADPLVTKHWFKARTAIETLAAMDRIKQEAKQVTWPVLIVHGTADVLCRPSGSKNFVEAISSTDKQLIYIEGSKHEVFNDYDRVQTMGHVVNWIQARLPK
eukprot:g43091.t1